MEAHGPGLLSGWYRLIVCGRQQLEESNWERKGCVVSIMSNLE